MIVDPATRKLFIGEREPEAFAHFLREQFGSAGEPSYQRCSGGQSNPTYFVTLGQNEMVLRKQPSGSISPGAHAIHREHRVLGALSETAVPVPKPILYYEKDDVLDTPFYLMQRLHGRVFSDCSLPSVGRTDRPDVFFAMADVLAELHAIDPRTVGLADFGRPENYFGRQIRRWSKQYAETTGPRIPALEEASEWLTSNLPGDDGRNSIIHGDFRLGNIIFHPTDPIVMGVLDWELATLGHPLADLGFSCLPWHTSPSEYGGIATLDLEMLNLPTEDEYVRRYFASAVPTAPLDPFHLAFGLFRFAAIFVGIADRARLKTAASPDAHDVAPLAEKFAAGAMRVIEKTKSI